MRPFTPLLLAVAAALTPPAAESTAAGVIDFTGDARPKYFAGLRPCRRPATG